MSAGPYGANRDPNPEALDRDAAPVLAKFTAAEYQRACECCRQAYYPIHSRQRICEPCWLYGHRRVGPQRVEIRRAQCADTARPNWTYRPPHPPA